MSDLPLYVTLPWWREILDRAARNAVQTLIPVLVTSSVGSITGLDPLATLWVAFLAASVTVLKAFANIQITERTALAWVLLDRAGPAAAATLLSFVTIDGTEVVPVVDWRAAFIATAGAALLAVAQHYVSPAVVAEQEPADDEISDPDDPRLL